jgi:hypothetical protein
MIDTNLNVHYFINNMHYHNLFILIVRVLDLIDIWEKIKFLYFIFKNYVILVNWILCFLS